MPLRSRALYNPLYFSKYTLNPPIECLFAIALGEMYPVGLCLHILPDVLLHGYSRFLAEPRV